MKEKKIKVDGMHCEHCVANVTKALEALPGVRNVAVSLEDGMATLEAGMVASDDKLVAAVEGAGFTAEVLA